MRPSSVTDRRARAGQAAVETMIMAFGIAVILVTMVHLFSVTWASANAHIRAREVLLHGEAYIDSAKLSNAAAGNIPFDPSVRNYRKAEPGSSMNFSGEAWDTTRDDIIGSQSIQVQARITE